ncbi:hypothetical protein EW145_g446 [Phellinidium pouzarii]|uniref:Uncharacterized protein n=1 Tax=Phellinidium pouzarii TaxID=167371 RepID=A0A4S4LIT6_9AGAM|nr:hypothetical protein EW145_g446 [Phellinidium pouzarii]
MPLMDRYYAPNTPEARAHSRINENIHWEDEHHSLNETLIALCASYQALSRYISGADIYLMPRSQQELESKLKRYAYDAIHNMIAQSKSPMERGGYSRVCHMAEQSIRSVLSTDSNTTDLLNMHRRHDELKSPVEGSPGRTVATK